jgi:hypothetical protein
MKLNRIITLCAMAAAMTLSTGSLFAQDNGGGNGGGNNAGQDNGGNGGNGGQGGQGGQRRNRQGGGFGNFDPAQMQQRMVDGARDRLEFTNDTDWSAVEPLVQKVVAARFDVGMGMRGMFGGRNRGGNNGGPGGGRPGFGQTGPEQEALQNALDANAPAGQIKDLLAKYKAVQKAKQDKLEAAQADLKAVLTTKQEAEAYLMGLVN